MQVISRGHGLTTSERFLKNIAERTFLDLWSYANVYYQPGKEFCDLLVICSPHIIIFSDKNIKCSADGSNESWARWYKKAIQKSVDQIKGAERWLKRNPTSLFIDANCQNRIPISFPEPENWIIHGICIATGAEEAVNSYSNDNDGCLFINPDLEGDDHINFDKPGHLKFSVGDVNPNGIFVHVFDKNSLKIIMDEFDTITDFTKYILHRKNIIKNKILGLSSSESEIVADYIYSFLKHGHPNLPNLRLKRENSERHVFMPGFYEYLYTLPEHYVYKTSLKISYAWDELIKFYTKPVIEGNSVKFLDFEPNTIDAERAIKFMALESRLSRRHLGDKICDLIIKFKKTNQNRLARILFPNKDNIHHDQLYLFLIYEYSNDIFDTRENYRKVRAETLYAYCFCTLEKYRKYKRIVGIAIDSPNNSIQTEDLVVFENTQWNSEDAKLAEKYKKEFDILSDSRMIFKFDSYTTKKNNDRDRRPPKKYRKIIAKLKSN